MQTELDVAKRRVEEAERHVARQKALLASLDPTDSLRAVGASLLVEMEAQLAAEKDNRDWVVRNGWAERPATPR